MKAVWKFPLTPHVQEQSISMPYGAKPLCVQMQGETPTLWALVDPDAAKNFRPVLMFGTGHPVSPVVEHGQYIGTVQDPMGYVWHYFLMQ